MRLLALIVALVSFTCVLGTFIGVAAGAIAPVHGAVLIIVGLAATAWWLSIADRH